MSEMLTSYGFQGRQAGGARKSARRDNGEPARSESRAQLMEALESLHSVPEREIDKPFMMPIETCSRSRGAQGGDGPDRSGKVRSARTSQSGLPGRREKRS